MDIVVANGCHFTLLLMKKQFRNTLSHSLVHGEPISAVLKRDRMSAPIENPTISRHSLILARFKINRITEMTFHPQCEMSQPF